MKIVNKKLTLLAGLMALTITSSAYGSTEEFTQDSPGLKKCPQMEKYKGNDRRIEIIVDKDGEISLENGHFKEFWHKDTLTWKVVTTPLQKKQKNKNSEIKNFQIEFKNYKGCSTNPSNITPWPCKESWLGKWKEGKEEATARKTISCKIREDALNQWYGDHPGEPVNDDPWQYCYVITVNRFDGSYRKLESSNIDNSKPVGGGNGCGGCHTDTSF